jgi:hypothetical protein
MSKRGRQPTQVATDAYGEGIRYISISSFVVLLVFSYSVSVSSWAFQGGTGEPYDPYQIANVEQLLRLNADIELMTKSFVLVRDIDLDPNGPESHVFDAAVIGGTLKNDILDQVDSGNRPVGGCKVTVFQGTFLGNGHTIRNMVIDASESKCIGLFAYLGENAVVSDLQIEGSSARGRMHVGLLAGINCGKISYCEASGLVSAESRAGGMIGTNRGTIASCCAQTSVTGKDILGGLVGHAIGKSSVTHSRALSHVVGYDKVGGLVGQMLRGTLEGCFASGAVTSKAEAGGLVGAGPFGGTVRKCSSAVNVRGVVVGGLIGTTQRTIIANSHAFGSLELVNAPKLGSTSALGGIVGSWRSGSGSIISSSWNTIMAPTHLAVGYKAPKATVNLVSTHGDAPRPTYPWSPFFHRAATCP